MLPRVRVHMCTCLPAVPALPALPPTACCSGDHVYVCACAHAWALP